MFDSFMVHWEQAHDKEVCLHIQSNSFECFDVKSLVVLAQQVHCKQQKQYQWQFFAAKNGKKEV